MTEDEATGLGVIISDFVDLYCELIKVNRRIGIWDMRRNEVCKSDIPDIELSYLVKTERLGRIAVEKRALLKTRIDELFAEIVSLRMRISDNPTTAREA
jgi:hypothetical protein